MKSPAIYKVNDKALNNGKQTIYSKSITILNKELKEITLNNILENAGQAQGCRVYVRDDSIKIDRSNPPENTIHIIGDDVFVETESYNYHLNPKLDYSAISDTKNIAAIEKNVVNAAYVTSSETIAKGEWTVVFAKPGDGKTLIILTTIAQQISNGIINGDDVFYFNLDDARNGYLEKLKILEPLNVIVFDEDPVSVMIKLINERQAKDKVVIIDTLIRVCDTNSRQDIMRLSLICKRFCELGGTVITLAHANKYVDKNGAPILEGVGLIRNNAHCVCYLQKFDDIIKMVNIKKRTHVEVEVTFQIGKDLNYTDLFNSVRTLTGDQATRLFKDRERDQLAKDHNTIVKTIQETILHGIDHRTALAKVVYENTGDYKKTIFNVLDELEGKLWKMTRGLNNSQVYSII